MGGDRDASIEGLKGWRAFLAVVGSGVLAAFIVVALVVGVFNMAFGGSSSSGDNPAIAKSREPRESTAPGVLNLCDLVEGQSLASAAPFNRIGDTENYSDTAEDNPGEDPRTVRDECSWEVASASGGNWIFSLSYVAIMEAKGNRRELANREYDRRVEDMSEELSSVTSEGSVERLEGKSRYAYGSTDSGGRAYRLVRMVKTGVYEITFKDPEDTGKDPVSEQDFRTQMQLVVPYLDTAFEHQIPD